MDIFDVISGLLPKQTMEFSINISPGRAVISLINFMELRHSQNQFAVWLLSVKDRKRRYSKGSADIQKTAFQSRYVHWEFSIMSLRNQRLPVFMNLIDESSFLIFLGKIVKIFIDDILA